MPFITYDHDNSGNSKNCALERKGPFWYDQDCGPTNPLANIFMNDVKID